MSNDNDRSIIEAAIKKTAEMNPQDTDGEWLEVVTVESGPYVKEWDIGQCWHWDEWPEREARFPNTTRLDVGIDAVAVRRGDGRHVAIQCKSRQLDETGRGSSINNNEIAKFAAASAANFWAERWIVTNGNNPLASGAEQSASMSDKPIKLVNITNDLLQQQQASAPSGMVRPLRRTPMTKAPSRREVLYARTRLSRTASGSSKNKKTRRAAACPSAKLVAGLSCPAATGKTRVSLRIVEELTPLGRSVNRAMPIHRAGCSDTTRVLAETPPFR